MAHNLSYSDLPVTASRWAVLCRNEDITRMNPTTPRDDANSQRSKIVEKVDLTQARRATVENWYESRGYRKLTPSQTPLQAIVYPRNSCPALHGHNYRPCNGMLQPNQQHCSPSQSKSTATSPGHAKCLSNTADKIRLLAYAGTEKTIFLVLLEQNIRLYQKLIHYYVTAHSKCIVLYV